MSSTVQFNGDIVSNNGSFNVANITSITGSLIGLPQTFRVNNPNSGLLLLSTGGSTSSCTTNSKLSYLDGTLASPGISVSTLSVTGTFQFGLPPQTFYPHGANGFSVNENFDASNSSTQTAYHFTSGNISRNIVFDLAVTGQYTTMFGTYGTAGSNQFVIGSETANTSFSFKKGLGIQPINLAGGTTLMNIDNNGNMSLPLGTLLISNSTNATGSATGALIVTGGINANGVSVFNNTLYAPSLNPNFINRGNPGRTSELLLSNYNTVHYYSVSSSTGYIDISTLMVENAVYEVEFNCYGASSTNNDMYLYPNYTGYSASSFYTIYTQSVNAGTGVFYASNNSIAFYFDYVSGTFGWDPVGKIIIYNNRSAKKVKLEAGDTTATVNGQGYWTSGASNFERTTATPIVYDTTTQWNTIGRISFSAGYNVTFSNWNVWVKRIM